METVERTVSLEYIEDIAGKEIVEFLQKKCPTKVFWRVLKSYDHIEKAMRLDGIDDEMGAIRLIAAEEELVVAIFEWLKINENKMPEHRDLVRSYKNYQVKLMFYPVLSILHFAIGWIFKDGFSFEGLEHFQMKLIPKVDQGAIVFTLCQASGKKIIDVNPLAVVIRLEDKTQEEVIGSLYRELVDKIENNHYVTLRQYMMLRSDYRNKLLYAEDGGFITGGDTVKSLLNEGGFRSTFRDLLWTLATLVGNDPISSNFGLITQFISVYRKVLMETKVIRDR